jgi:hypothetical protein
MAVIVRSREQVEAREESGARREGASRSVEGRRGARLYLVVYLFRRDRV